MIYAFINVSCKYNLYKLLEKQYIKKTNYNHFFKVLWNYKKIIILIIILKNQIIQFKKKKRILIKI
jgi:hypothetical protein